MWLPKSLFELFTISKDYVEDLRVEVEALRREQDLLKSELASAKANWEWARVRMNALEVERAQLMKKAYNVDIPIPEISVAPKIPPMLFNSALFEDVGDKLAGELGLPVYDDRN